MLLAIGHPRTMGPLQISQKRSTSQRHKHSLATPSSHILVGLTRGAPNVVYFQSGAHLTEKHLQTFFCPLLGALQPGVTPPFDQSHCHRVALPRLQALCDRHAPNALGPTHQNYVMYSYHIIKLRERKRESALVT